MHSGANTCCSAACVTGEAANPNASPHPLMPPSVSMRTSNASIEVQGPLERIGLGPPCSNGTEMTIGSG
jgi:hypothetical protein